MLGLKRGTVKLLSHQVEWETEANNTILELQSIFGSIAKDIQHIGSTSIPFIKSKPIIDIVIAVDDFKEVINLEDKLKIHEYYYRPNKDISNQLLIAKGGYYNGNSELQTHFIHIVLSNSMEYLNYINFRDYLIKYPITASKYEQLKINLASSFPNDREQYLNGKKDFIEHTLRKALVDSFMGKNITVMIDRPIGTIHPKHPGLIYPINYGYIPEVIGGDGEELDVYIIGVKETLKTFNGKVIGIVHRTNDVEDKLVAAPSNMIFNREEIANLVRFQEQFYDITIESLYTKN